MIRSFVALPMSGEAARALRGRQSPIPGARSVPEDDFHLTLAFLGDQPEAHLRSFVRELCELAARTDPIAISLVLPDLLGGKSPRAITVAAEKSSALLAFQSRLEHILREGGLDLARRRFRPHVTLYRLPNTPAPGTPGAIQAWLDGQAGAGPISFRAASFRLYGSQLTPEGPIYSTLAEFPLAQSHGCPPA